MQGLIKLDTCYPREQFKMPLPGLHISKDTCSSLKCGGTAHKGHSVLRTPSIIIMCVCMIVGWTGLWVVSGAIMSLPTGQGVSVRVGPWEA